MTIAVNSQGIFDNLRGLTMDKKINQSGKCRNSRTSRIFGACLVLVIFGLGLQAYGQPGLPGLPVRDDGGRNTSSAGDVKVELVSQYEGVAPGQRFGIAVVLEVAQGWHLYANPKQGEFGLDT